jgi:hypothetical protein
MDCRRRGPCRWGPPRQPGLTECVQPLPGPTKPLAQGVIVLDPVCRAPRQLPLVLRVALSFNSPLTQDRQRYRSRPREQ